MLPCISTTRLGTLMSTAVCSASHALALSATGTGRSFPPQGRRRGRRWIVFGNRKVDTWDCGWCHVFCGVSAWAVALLGLLAEPCVGTASASALGLLSGWPAGAACCAACADADALPAAANADGGIMTTASTTESTVETTTDAGLAIVAPLLAEKTKQERRKPATISHSPV